MNIIDINNLSIEYYRHSAVIPAVRGVSLSLKEGETLSLVGESGSGKSSLALALLGLIAPQDGRVTSGAIIYNGRDLRLNTPDEWRALRGKEISMVFQDPFAALNPVLTAGEQLCEAVRAHDPLSNARAAENKAFAALEEVRFSEPRRIMHSFPHQLSGGQRQRVVIAMAIVNRPRLLIADEPTTALDVTIQKEILDLLDTLKKELSLTVLLITHNLPLAGQRSERIAVMYAGEIVEVNRREDIFSRPRHPYTKALIRSIPRLKDKSGERYLLSGQVPDLTRLPAGCSFAPRCAEAMPRCTAGTPPVFHETDGRVQCFLCGEKDK